MTHRYEVTLSEHYVIEADNERDAKLEALTKFSEKYKATLDTNHVPSVAVRANLEALDI